jgi:hypothetical protein
VTEITKKESENCVTEPGRAKQPAPHHRHTLG